MDKKIITKKTFGGKTEKTIEFNIKTDLDFSIPVNKATKYLTGDELSTIFKDSILKVVKSEMFMNIVNNEVNQLSVTKAIMNNIN